MVEYLYAKIANLFPLRWQAIDLKSPLKLSLLTEYYIDEDIRFFMDKSSKDCNFSSIKQQYTN